MITTVGSSTLIPDRFSLIDECVCADANLHYHGNILDPWCNITVPPHPVGENNFEDLFTFVDVSLSCRSDFVVYICEGTVYILSISNASTLIHLPMISEPMLVFSFNHMRPQIRIVGNICVFGLRDDPNEVLVYEIVPNNSVAIQDYTAPTVVKRKDAPNQIAGTTHTLLKRAQITTPHITFNETMLAYRSTFSNEVVLMRIRDRRVLARRLDPLTDTFGRKWDLHLHGYAMSRTHFIVSDGKLAIIYDLATLSEVGKFPTGNNDYRWSEPYLSEDGSLLIIAEHEKKYFRGGSDYYNRPRYVHDPWLRLRTRVPMPKSKHGDWSRSPHADDHVMLIAREYVRAGKGWRRLRDRWFLKPCVEFGTGQMRPGVLGPCIDKDFKKIEWLGDDLDCFTA